MIKFNFSKFSNMRSLVVMAAKRKSSGSESLEGKPVRKVSDQPITGPIGVTPTTQPRVLEVLDVKQLVETARFQIVREWENQLSRDFEISNGVTVGELVDAVLNLNLLIGKAVRGLTSDSQKRLIDRDVANDAVAGFKHANALLANAGLCQSIIEKVVANRLNVIRKENLDNKTGKSTVSIKVGMVLPMKDGKLVRYSNDGTLVELTPEEESVWRASQRD